MSELLPNLTALVDVLPAGASGDDVRALARTAAAAKTETELDAALAVVISDWLGK